MDFRIIENKISTCYINTLMKSTEEDFSIKDLAKKCKINFKEAKLVFPYKDDINKKLLMKIFLKNADETVLVELRNEFDDEDVQRLDIIFKYKNAIYRLSNTLNQRILNFNFLIIDNHSYMKKLLLLSGEDNQFIKLEIKSFLLNAIYIKEIYNFLRDENYDQNLSMRNVDKSLKKIFEIKTLF